MIIICVSTLSRSGVTLTRFIITSTVPVARLAFAHTRSLSSITCTGVHRLHNTAQTGSSLEDRFRASLYENLRPLDMTTRCDLCETRSKTISALSLLRKQMFCNPACVRLKNARFAVTFSQSTEKGPGVHRTNCAASSKRPIAFEFRHFEEAGSFAFVDWVNFCSGLLAAMIQHACAVLNVSAMWTRRWHGLRFLLLEIPSGCWESFLFLQIKRVRIKSTEPNASNCRQLASSPWSEFCYTIYARKAYKTSSLGGER